MNDEERKKRIMMALLSIIMIYIAIMLLIFLLDVFRVINFDFSSSFVIFVAIFPGSIASIAAALSESNQNDTALNNHQEEV